MELVTLALLMLGPALALWGATLALRAVTRMDLSSWRLGRRRQPVPTHPPIERLGADLRRLAADLERIERSDLPAKVARMRATSLAYDGVLLSACRALEVPVPVPAPPLEPLDRLQAEAALAGQGLVW